MMTYYFNKGKQKFKDFFNQYYLKGKIVNCGICKWNGSTFPNNRCPKCRSLARTRLIPFSINYFKINNKNDKILHVAPNVSEYNFVLNNVDYELYDRLNINEVPHVNIQQDLTNLTLESNTYDQMIAWHVLEHIPDDQKAIKEMYRVLKKGGRLLLSVPIYPENNPKTIETPDLPREKFEEVHGHDDHCRSCGLDYFERFEKEGFNTKTLHVKDLDATVRKKYGLSNSHTVWCFTK